MILEIALQPAPPLRYNKLFQNPGKMHNRGSYGVNEAGIADMGRC